MTSYTNDWGLPKPGPSDLIAGTSSNLRLDLGALAEKTDQGLTQAVAQADSLQRPLETGEDVLSVSLKEGHYPATAAVAASLVNRPAEASGTSVLVRYSAPAPSSVRFAFYMAYGSGGGLWFNRMLTAVGTPTWAGWTRLDVDPTQLQPANESLGLNRTMLRQEFVRRRGGKIGTNGKAMIALRYDDSTDGLINHGIDVKLRDLQLPSTVLYCSETFEFPDLAAINTLGSWDYVADTAHQQGMEVWHHGGNHRDASGETALRREIVESLETMESHLPTVEVNKWAQPGVGGTNYDGFAGTHTAGQLYETTAGRLIAESHAISNGHHAGKVVPLNGHAQDSVWHHSVDTPARLSEAYELIEDAVDLGAGLTIMVHPANLDRDSSYTTATDYLELVEHVAQLRDDGDIEVLTMSGMLCADISTDYRANVIRNKDFSRGWRHWTNTSGWVVQASTGTAVTSDTGLLTQTHAIDRHGWFLGGTMQLVARVRSAEGCTARLIQGNAYQPASWTAEQDYEIPAGDDWHTIRLNAVTPLGMSRYGDAIHTRIGRLSGGSLEVESVQYVPV